MEMLYVSFILENRSFWTNHEYVVYIFIINTAKSFLQWKLPEQSLIAIGSTW